MLISRLLLAGGCLAVLLVPAWWLAGRLEERSANPLWRFLWAVGLALVGYLTFVNLVGRVVDNSTTVASVYLVLNAGFGIALLLRYRQEASWAPFLSGWRLWLGVVGLALIAGAPQWFLAVSTPYWDEVASSAIHVSAPNQFAEGVFPPRHNALPDVVIKYHYGFTILSGTIRWLTGLTANVSIDFASTLLWLFAFLLILAWCMELGLGRFAALWGALAALLGGGLSWLYLRRIEVYSGNAKLPSASELLHVWDGTKSWGTNLLATGQVPSLHLRNGDGSLSNLPWDIAALFQQHAAALGLALTLFALVLFVAWERRSDGLRLPLMVANILTFGVLLLGHAAFGSITALTAGLWLLGAWILRPTRARFVRGLGFGIGVAALTLLHGGLFARGAQYGGDAVATLRDGFGYSAGGILGFLHWNLAGFGVPLLVAMAAWALHRRFRDPAQVDGNILFGVLTVLTLVSWLIPQVMFYSSQTIRVEQFNEIIKFLFVTRLGLAMLSAYGVSYLAKKIHWGFLSPAIPAMIIGPLVFIYAGAHEADGSWKGFYRSPYGMESVESQMGDTLRVLKRSPRDVYFDASADERIHGYLGEMFIYAGSIFTLTPSRYERTGIGYRLAEDVVAQRLVLNSRMARLQPGAPEECACSWYYSRPGEDLANLPLLVRSRFAKLVAEGYFVQRHAVRRRTLYSIERPTRDLDAGLDRYWRPRIVTQVSGGGAIVPRFYHLEQQWILEGTETVDLPPKFRGQSVVVYAGRFAGGEAGTLLVGRMQDTHFSLGARIEDLNETSGLGWTFHDASRGGWQAEAPFWYWNVDVPFVADLDHDGVDSHLSFRPRTSEWLVAPAGTRLAGPSVPAGELPVPFGGRFLPGSTGDLGIWHQRNGAGMVTLRSLSADTSVLFRWGGRPGDVLVPGDYDGDGYDEIAVWQQTNQTWYWRRAPDGPVTQATFGTATGIPVPADYNGDGRMDLAYWEPREGRIHVSFDHGRTVARVITVPAGSIPVFVNMN